jgi:hypothetical protein
MSTRSDRRGVSSPARVFSRLHAEDALLPGEASVLRRSGALFLALMVLGAVPLFMAANASGLIGDVPSALASSGPGHGGSDGDDDNSGPGSGDDDDDDTTDSVLKGTDDTSANGHSTRGTTDDNDTRTNQRGTNDTSANGDSTRGTTDDNDTRTNSNTHTRTGH